MLVTCIMVTCIRSESKDEFESDESSFFGILIAKNHFLDWWTKDEKVKSTLKATNLKATKKFQELNTPPI